MLIDIDTDYVADVPTRGYTMDELRDRLEQDPTWTAVPPEQGYEWSFISDPVPLETYWPRC